MTESKRAGDGSQLVSGRRGSPRRNAVLVTLAGAALTLLAVAQSWANGTLVDALFGRQALSAGGTSVAPAVLLLTFVGIAGVVASTISGRILRVICGLVVVMASAGIVVLAVRAGTDPESALASAAAGSSGRTGVRPQDAASTLWPWVSALGGVILACGGALVIRGGRQWTVRASRFERGASGEQGTQPAQAQEPGPAGRRGGPEDWEQLSRDEDPTT